VNITDAESRVMHTADGGNVQGYNAQVVCADGQVVLAAAVCNDVNDWNQLVPMLDELASSLDAAGVTQDLGVMLADAGYFTAANMTALQRREIEALIATTRRHELPEIGSTHDPAAEAAEWAAFEADQARVAELVAAEQHRRAEVFERVDREGLDICDHFQELGISLNPARVGLRQWRAGGVDAISVRRPRWRVKRPRGRTPAQLARDAMNDRFADPANRELYKQRSHLVETYFGHTKSNRRVTRFMRRGLAAVNAEWQLIATAHNIERLQRAAS
jgi:hypothetical protein